MIPAPTHADTIVVLVPDRVDSGRRGMGAWADFYASHGYASLAIDVLVPKAATASPVYPKPERDTKAAIQYVRAHADRLGVDPSRIVVQGFGAGAALGAGALVSADDGYFDGSGRYEGVSDRVDGFIGFSGVFDGSTPNNEQYYGGPSGSADPAVQDRYERADSIAAHVGGDRPSPAVPARSQRCCQRHARNAIRRCTEGGREGQHPVARLAADAISTAILPPGG